MLLHLQAEVTRDIGSDLGWPPSVVWLGVEAMTVGVGLGDNGVIVLLVVGGRTLNAMISARTRLLACRARDGRG